MIKFIYRNEWVQTLRKDWLVEEATGKLSDIFWPIWWTPLTLVFYNIAKNLIYEATQRTGIYRRIPNKLRDKFKPFITRNEVHVLSGIYASWATAMNLPFLREFLTGHVSPVDVLGYQFPWTGAHLRPDLTDVPFLLTSFLFTDRVACKIVNSLTSDRLGYIRDQIYESFGRHYNNGFVDNYDPSKEAEHIIRENTGDISRSLTETNDSLRTYEDFVRLYSRSLVYTFVGRQNERESDWLDDLEILVEEETQRALGVYRQTLGILCNR